MSSDNPPDDLDTTGIRKVSLQEQDDGGASAVYHSLELLRNVLPASAQRMLAVSFEWARKGTAQHGARTGSSDLETLSSAYAFARDEMLTAAKENESG
jgi:hypothetical protein